MERISTDSSLGEYSVRYDPADMVDWRGLRVPKSFTASFTQERLRVRIDVVVSEEEPECVAISRLDDDAPPLTSERRLPLRAMVRAAVRAAAFEIVEVPVEQLRSLQKASRVVLHANTQLVPDRHGNVRLYAPAFDDASERHAPPVQRRPQSDDDWRLIATLYRRALAGGTPPSRAIAAEFGVTRATARKWVQVARQRGFLGTALGRRAGEASSSE